MAGVAVGLDFASVFAAASAQGADLELLAEALPEVEIAIIAGMTGEIEEE